MERLVSVCRKNEIPRWAVLNRHFSLPGALPQLWFVRKGLFQWTPHLFQWVKGPREWRAYSTASNQLPAGGSRTMPRQPKRMETPC